jgi:hypothetical protein
MKRRQVLARASVVALTAPALTACSGSLTGFGSWADAQKAVLELLFQPRVVQGNTWNLSQVLQHLAQSIEFSMKGFPELKGAVFRATLGNAAFAVFNARGAMSHSLDEPIPGAPALAADQTLKTSVQRLLDAMDAFAAWSGPLQPHFAYGELSKAQYQRAHLMHLSNHWQQIQLASATA